MRVAIEIPDQEWFRLLKLAEAHGLSIADLIVHGIHEVAPRSAPQGEDVMRFVRMGFTTRTIAKHMGISPHVVGKIRQRYGQQAEGKNR